MSLPDFCHGLLSRTPAVNQSSPLIFTIGYDDRASRFQQILRLSQ